jgi:glucose/arabinose dehydrogenase
MTIRNNGGIVGGLLFASMAMAGAQQQSDFYKREEIPLPPGEVMELGSIALMPDQKIAVTSRRGDLWICTGAYGSDLTKVTWSKFAEGLHEPLGMFWKDGWLYLTQRPEVTRIKDSDGDGKADTFETINSDWGIKGDYHEYTFGSDPDKNGDIWTVLCLTGSFTADSPYRGWAMRITPKGEMIPTCSGIRSPGGIGMNAEGDVFYTDNQGPWNGSSSLKWLKPGSFQGNPQGNKFYADTKAIGPRPVEPHDKSRILTERKRIKEFVPPAVVFPHAKVGHSPSGIVADTTGGKFGPWEKQLYVGEQTKSEVQRVCLEKVNGLYQGAVFHFLKGFEAGIVPVRQGEDGTLFVGGTNRGWASSGTKPFTFERVRWTGKTPFEMQAISALKDGFEVTFTEPVDAATAGKAESYAMGAWTYIYQAEYGSPEVDATKPKITAAEVSADKKKVRLKVDGMVQGHVHHLEAKGVRSATGGKLWHDEGWYTLNEVPR